MARSNVFTIAQHFDQLVRRIHRWGGIAANYLTPAQVIDLNSAEENWNAHWGPASSTYVQYRQQP